MHLTNYKWKHYVKYDQTRLNTIKHMLVAYSLSPMIDFEFSARIRD